MKRPRTTSSNPSSSSGESIANSTSARVLGDRLHLLPHGCGGFSSHSVEIADQMGSWGYVNLAVDNLGSRGIVRRCGSVSLDQAFDAYAALRYLSRLDFVDPTRVGVLGQGSACLVQPRSVVVLLAKGARAAALPC